MRRCLALLAVGTLLLAALVACGARGAGRPGAAPVPAARPTTVARTLTVGDRERTYVLHLPPANGGGAPLPLVLVFHGGGGAGRQLDGLTGMNAVADRDGFAVAYPDGLGHGWNDGRFSPAVEAQRDGVDDVGFVSALIDELATALPIDRRRVYATGISNGGMLSERLGCELAGKLAAIAPVAGSFPALIAPGCTPAHAMPVLLIAGTADPIVPWAGGAVRLGGVGGDEGARGDVLSAPATVARWAALDGCVAAPVVTREPDRDPNDGTQTRRETVGGCRDGAEVVLYAVEGGGHTWPGGRQYLPVSVIGATSRDFDASATIWAFFARHPRP